MGQEKIEDVGLTKTQIKKKIESLKDKIKYYELSLKQFRKNISLLKRKLVVTEQLQKVMREGLKTLNPQREFEQNPEFWALQKRLQEIRDEEELNEIRFLIEQNEEQVNDRLEKIKEFKEEIERLKQKL